jgi:hypothetical protein
MDFKLDFAIIGVQKSATTWLYECLNEHPQANMRGNKHEDDYFGGQVYKQKGHDWYVSLFKNDDTKLKGCVSVDYIEDETSPTFLYENNPNVKLIISLRNPVNRLISAYQWYIRKSFIPNLPIEEGLQLMLKHYRGEIKNEHTAQYLNLIDRGRYSVRLERFFKVFPKAQIHIVHYDDIKKDGQQVLKGLFAFLGIDANFIPPNINTQPKKNTGNSLTTRIQRTFPNSKVVGKITDIINQTFFANQKYDAKEKVTNETMAQIREIYQPEYKKLETILLTTFPENKNIVAQW